MSIRGATPLGLCADALIVLLCASAAWAQTVPTDSDPTRPILFSVRPEYSNIAPDAWRMQLIARYDTAVVRKRRWFSGRRGMLIRLELPASVADSASTATQAGLGDAYAQVLIVPRLSRRFAYVIGSGLSMPTATDTILGSGKWIAAPAAAPVWFLRGGGLFYVKVQNFTSIAGDAARPDVNFLLITPTMIRRAGSRTWWLLDTETKSDWRLDGRTGVKSGVQVGRLVSARLAVWVKPEVFWGPNRAGRWNVKTGVVWYRS